MLNPAQARIAQSNCIKPDHVTGAHLVPPYEDIIKLISQLDPSIETIGTIFNSSETSGATGAEIIAALGEEAGLQILQAAVSGIADIGLAIEGLVSRGSVALVLPIDSVTAQGLLVTSDIAIEHGTRSFTEPARA